MSPAHTVFWTDTAAEDLRSIVAHIRSESPQNAKTVLDQIRRSTADLDHLPLRGRIVPELLAFGITQYRELIVSRWRIIYKPQGDRVFIFAIFDARQNVEEILFWRLIRE